MFWLGLFVGLVAGIVGTLYFEAVELGDHQS